MERLGCLYDMNLLPKSQLISINLFKLYSCWCGFFYIYFYEKWSIWEEVFTTDCFFGSG
jgi:hypothetical protein